jgi:hypothetical protein
MEEGEGGMRVVVSHHPQKLFEKVFKKVLTTG